MKGSLLPVQFSYKNNYHSECILEENARTKVIIFCKSHPLNWQLECILKTIDLTTNQGNQARMTTTMTTRLHDTSLKGHLLLKFLLCLTINM